jgi:hypothetical protein
MGTSIYYNNSLWASTLKKYHVNTAGMLARSVQQLTANGVSSLCSVCSCDILNCVH